MEGLFSFVNTVKCCTYFLYWTHPLSWNLFTRPYIIILFDTYMPGYVVLNAHQRATLRWAHPLLLNLKYWDLCNFCACDWSNTINQVDPDMNIRGREECRSKIKPSHYRPRQVLRFPGGWGSHFSRQSVHDSKVSPTHCPPLPPRKYSWYSFFFRGWFNPRTIVLPEGLCQ